MASPHPPRSAPTLTDGVVTLRAHRPEDLPAIMRQGVDEEMVRWTTVPTPYTRRDAEAFLRSASDGWAGWTGHCFAIDTGGGYAGAIDLRPIGLGAAEIGYALAPWARGRRTMSRAARLALAWGFHALDLEVVHWKAHVGNWASRRVAWAVGFRVEGTVRGLLAHRDRRVDAWIGSLRRADSMNPAHPWLDPPVLHGDGVTLREHQDADAPRIVEACGDARTQYWLGHLPRPYTREHAADHLRRLRDDQAAGRAVHWAVTDAGGGPLLAEVAVFVRDQLGCQGEIGYWAHPAARGRGVVTTATRLASRHALLPSEDGGLGMERLLLRAAAANSASQQVARNAGFRRTGVDRAADRLGDGTVVDDVRFDLLPAELPAARDREQPHTSRRPRSGAAASADPRRA